jgi:TatD DNase family protein
MQYIDIHGHINFSAFDSDRDEVIDRASKNSVAIVTVGTQFETSSTALAIAKKHDFAYAVVGLHPIHTSKSHHDVAELGEGNREFTSKGEVVNFEKYIILANDNKTIAIGECGLDYYHNDEESNQKQVQAFVSMIDLANLVRKPLMLHLRSGSGKSAYKEALKILKDRSRVLGNLHFYAGSIEEAKPFLDLGYSFSFTGAITFANNYAEVIKYLPLDRIMTETDCPYVSPLPHRGKRNEPSYVIEVVKKIAEIKGLDQEIVRQHVLGNAKNFFSISL